MPFKIFHSRKITGQLQGKKRKKESWVDGIKSSRQPLRSQAHIFSFSPPAPALSVSLSGLHVFVHRLWGSCTSCTQCTNMQLAEQSFRGDLFSSCAGLSYIHGNQPVQLRHPVRQDSNKTEKRSPLWISCGDSWESVWVEVLESQQNGLRSPDQRNVLLWFQLCSLKYLDRGVLLSSDYKTEGCWCQWKVKNLSSLPWQENFVGTCILLVWQSVMNSLNLNSATKNMHKLLKHFTSASGVTSHRGDTDRVDTIQWFVT